MKFYDTNPIDGAIEITTQIGCKINCHYCPQSIFVKKYREMFPEGNLELSLEKFVTYIETIPSKVRIEFSGMCEPFLNRECLDMLLYAHKKGHSIGVYTTLVGVDETILERLLDIEFDVFCIHLPDSDNNTIINIDNNYLRILSKAVEKIKGYKYFTFQGKDVYRDIKKYVIDKLQFSNIIYDRAGVVEEPKIHLNGQIKCSSMCHDNVLLPNGIVLLCCQDYGLEYVLGDLSKENYQSVLNGEKMMHIFEMMENDEDEIMCRNCYFAQPASYQLQDPALQVLLEKNINMQWKLLESKNLIENLRNQNLELKRNISSHKKSKNL